MWQIYGFYLVPFLFVLLAHAVWTLPTHPQPWLGVLAHLFCMPGLLISFSIQGVFWLSEEAQAALSQARAEGHLPPSHTCLIGLTSGSLALVSVGVILAIVFMGMDSDFGAILGILVSVQVTMIVPAITLQRVARAMKSPGRRQPPA